eukprot:365320-Chlamydomonas_euryale.AAC.2
MAAHAHGAAPPLPRQVRGRMAAHAHGAAPPLPRQIRQRPSASPSAAARGPRSSGSRICTATHAI